MNEVACSSRAQPYGLETAYMKLAIKQVARRWLGDRLVGSIDYYRFPEKRSAWGGPFNGQANRLRIFNAIIARVRPTAIIETGTYLGTTTEFMAGTGLPIYTIEGHPRHYGFARARLWRKPNVQLYEGDSRYELRKLFDGPLKYLTGESFFFYLDAHWSEDLPLADEIDIIFARSSKAVVMIDDFEVPGDPGFGYDDYGSEKALNAKYVASLAETHDLEIFYPSAPSWEETGSRRGCAVLCKSGSFGGMLASIPLLRQAIDNISPEQVPNISPEQVQQSRRVVGHAD
jgi:predicted O-methyltransferase YrrM